MQLIGRYTKTQLLNIFKRWSVREPPPGAGKVVIVCFPPELELQLRIARITKSKHKATYGGPLWDVEMGHKLED